MFLLLFSLLSQLSLMLSVLHLFLLSVCLFICLLYSLSFYLFHPFVLWTSRAQLLIWFNRLRRLANESQEDFDWDFFNFIFSIKQHFGFCPSQSRINFLQKVQIKLQLWKEESSFSLNKFFYNKIYLAWPFSYLLLLSLIQKLGSLTCHLVSGTRIRTHDLLVAQVFSLNL